MSRQNSLLQNKVQKSTHIHMEMYMLQTTFRLCGENELLSEWCGDNWVTIWEKRKLDPYLVPNIKPRWNRIEMHK